MRLVAIRARDVAPVQRFEVEGLADTVVLAGRNGIGKTRLVQAIMQALRNPNSGGSVQVEVEATSEEEKKAWGKDRLVTSEAADCKLLARTLQASRRRVKWRSSIVQFESDRSIQRLKPYQFNWDVGDPWEEDVGWDQTFGFLRDRFQDTVHSIFRKIQGRRDRIARKAESLMKKGQDSMQLNFEDPLAAFRSAFSQLLAPKKLVDPDLKAQQLQYEHDGVVRRFDTLSSGEREVVNIVFDFLLRSPSHCIVFFDEPELHLHPELSYKLLQTLQHVAGRNQFVFCTHSPDIISSSLDQSVVFVGPPKGEHNQAIPVRSDDETNLALKLLGQSVGIVALGKILVLVEGSSASLDKQLYGSIVGSSFPELVLVPSEGRDVISSFATLNDNVLGKTLWGVEFFMLCDRDAVPPTANAAEMQRKASGRLRVLERYHLENYFLDPEILSSVFAELEDADSWMCDPQAIQNRLVEIARTRLSYTVALYVSAQLRHAVGSIDTMPKACHDLDREAIEEAILERANAEVARVGKDLDSGVVSSAVDQAWHMLERSLVSGEWIGLFPGKHILAIFASETLALPRLKRAYIRKAFELKSDVFADIEAVFASFADAGRPNSHKAPGC